MRWRRRSGTAPRARGLDALDPEALEVIELDAAGRRLGAPAATTDDAPAEMAYRPGPDPTSLAAIWEAIGRS